MQNGKSIVVNLYGGPGTGKSVTAAMLYAILATSSRYGVVEHVTEYAKELAWRIPKEPKVMDLLNNQKHVSETQINKLCPVCGQADLIITDSPIRIGLVYYLDNNREILDTQSDTPGGDYPELNRMMEKAESSYEEINIFLRRDEDAEFQNKGRVHSEEDSVRIDTMIKEMLDRHGKTYIQIHNKSDIGSVIGKIEEHLILNNINKVDIKQEKKIKSILEEGIDEISEGLHP